MDNNAAHSSGGKQAPRNVVIPYRPRAHQWQIHQNKKRFSVLVCHRRFGKTVAAVNELIMKACRNALPAPRYAYIAPLYKQAKSVVWDYLKKFAGALEGATFHETELRCDLPNGARISLLGADNPDRLRGIYLDGVVLDEMAQMPERVWGEIIRPALSDRLGWAMFIGTPRGHNAFYELYQFARQDPDWFCAMYRASETGIVNQEELVAAKNEMTPEQYEQEFECSFSAAIIGAYYGPQIAQAEKEGRITSVPVEPSLPVHTAWDLGMSDSTSVWFFQAAPGGEIRIVDYLEAAGQGLDYYVRALRDRQHLYGTHLAPHDIRVRELGTGKSRLEVAKSLGISFTVAPNLPLADGINAARLIIPKCWFDQNKCAPGLEALRQYRRVYNDRTACFGAIPHHDWTSHAADAFRYLAVGLDLCQRSATGMTASEACRMYRQFAPPAGI
ncbi:MAG: hypothetical protein JEZ02_00160 [Desulfatibacillum sp.]|nr:hypothetical protein [Desulfatibacillum sp.]